MSSETTAANEPGTGSRSALIPPPLPAEAGAKVPILEAGSSAPAASPGRRPGLLWRAVCLPWKLTLAAFFCQSFLFSILVVGWTQRLMQRAVLKSWWRVSPARKRGVSFVEFLDAAERTREHVSWPNWILAQPAGARGWRRRLLGSLGRNVRLGLQATCNIWVLTLPGCLLWAAFWYDGWNNSFNKGYENAWIAPSVFSLGIVLFIAAMFYVPLAHARQASTGNWRAFYQWRLNWHLVRRRWLAGFGLAVLCAGLSFPVMILRTWPQFRVKAAEEQLLKLERAGKPVPPGPRPVTELPPARQLAMSERYWFGAAFYVFPAFVLFRLFAARVYAGALRDAVQRGSVAPESLAEGEWEALHRLDLLTPRPPTERHAFVKLVAWLGTRAGRLTAGTATAIVWFLLVVQLMTSEFLSHTAWGRGWWNQPMIQLPWFNYTPQHLRDAARRDLPINPKPKANPDRRDERQPDSIR